MNDRLKQIRKYFKLTQKLFAEKIGIKQATYLSIEKGRRNLTEKRIKLICKVFNVNEEWIKTGKGNIFNSEVKRDEKQSINERIEVLIKKLNISKKEFANKINITPSYLSQVINKKTNFTEERIKLICFSFNISEEWIKTGKGNIFNSEIIREEKQEIKNKEVTNKDLEKEIKDLKEKVEKLTAIILNNKLV